MEMNHSSDSDALDPVAGANLISSNRKLLDIVFHLLRGDSAGPERADSEEANRPWVLCVDDDAEFAQALKMRLDARGIGVIRAADGMQGLRYAVTRPADAILLDYQLPNGRGDYILSRLKASPATADIPVIVITGERNRALERKMMNIGAARFMHKPPDINELLKELSKYVNVPWIAAAT